MNEVITKTFLKFILATAFLSPIAFAQSPERESHVTKSPWTFAVIKLQYATAEELAPVLSAVAPPGVKIVAYPPTNSLIIAGNPAIIRKLKTDDAGEP